jgi:hypothetical protein
MGNHHFDDDNTCDVISAASKWQLWRTSALLLHIDFQPTIHRYPPTSFFFLGKSKFADKEKHETILLGNRPKIPAAIANRKFVSNFQIRETSARLRACVHHDIQIFDAALIIPSTAPERDCTGYVFSFDLQIGLKNFEVSPIRDLTINEPT